MSLERPTFPMVRFTEGYDTEQVDLAVDMVRENLALPRPRIDRSEIEGLRFAPVRMRPGYSMDAVDDWLDQVVAELGRRGRAEPAATAPEGAVPVPAVRSSTAPPPSDAIVAIPNGSRRWLVVLALAAVIAVAVYVTLV